VSHARITVYEKPTCTTCRKLHDLLVEAGVELGLADPGVSDERLLDIL